jgi:uncharacterized membrane protein YphA (DoxX/SURF4 family)
MLAAVEELVDRARRRRWLHLVVFNLRLLIGFAFLPAGLKKLLDQPFTDPANHGRFHDFLHAFHATGGFYQFVGAVQLTAAVLLLTQRLALIGALVMLPVLTAIMVFCWSTAVYPTATVATSMWLGVVGLVMWDLPRWRGVLTTRPATAAPATSPEVAPWTRAGLIILALYLGATAFTGTIYRPRGVELDRPAFYLLMLIPLVPIVTLIRTRPRRIKD